MLIFFNVNRSTTVSSPLSVRYNLFCPLPHTPLHKSGCIIMHKKQHTSLFSLCVVFEDQVIFHPKFNPKLGPGVNRHVVYQGLNGASSSVPSFPTCCISPRIGAIVFSKSCPYIFSLLSFSLRFIYYLTKIL